MSEKYTEVYVLKITKTQKKTLEKLKDRNIKVANFVRQAIKEKMPHRTLKQFGLR